MIMLIHTSRSHLTHFSTTNIDRAAPFIWDRVTCADNIWLFIKVVQEALAKHFNASEICKISSGITVKD